MYLYLKLRSAVKRVSNISLVECVRPTVGTVTEERIDPALWFKVLVIDSIFVDCERRTVYWNSEKNKDLDRIHHLEVENLQCEDVCAFFQAKGFICITSDQDIYDPTVDELFDTAERVFPKLGFKKEKKEKNMKTYRELLRLVHVYILPAMQFQKSELHIIHLLLKEIERKHDGIEQVLVVKDKTKRTYEDSLAKQREILLKTHDFNSSKYVSSLSNKFLCSFLQHLEKDCKKLNEAVISNNEAIAPLRHSVCADNAKLRRLRAEREKLFDNLNTTIRAREEVKNVVSREHIKKIFKKSEQGMQDIHKQYVKDACELEVVNQEIKALINSKIKLSSIRESILLTIREINYDGSSYGYSQRKGPFEVEPDLFDTSQPLAEWATLRERVELCIKEANFQHLFDEFCERIKLKCQNMHEESKLFSADCCSSNETVALPSSADENFVTKEIKQWPPMSKFSSRWSVGTIAKHKRATLCDDIKEHLTDMAMKLAVKLSPGIKVTPSFQNKVYICYDEHVSVVLMPILCDVYEQCYHDQCQSLAEWISSVTFVGIGFGDENIINILTQLPVFTMESSCEISSEIEDTVHEELQAKLSNESSNRNEIELFKKRSTRKWYSKLNDCNGRMPESFIGGLEMDIPGMSPVIDGSGFYVKGNVMDDDVEMKKTDMIDGMSVNVTHNNLSINRDHQGSQEIKVTQINENDQTCHSICESNPNEQLHQNLAVSSQFRQFFEEFSKMIQEEDKVQSICSKISQITKTMKFVEHYISKWKGKSDVVAADDILDVFILLLCHMDSHWLLKLYAHINLMIHLSPTFMAGNAHDYALVTFSAAYQHLFEQQVLQRRKLTMKCSNQSL